MRFLQNGALLGGCPLFLRPGLSEASPVVSSTANRGGGGGAGAGGQRPAGADGVDCRDYLHYVSKSNGVRIVYDKGVQLLHDASD